MRSQCTWQAEPSQKVRAQSVNCRTSSPRKAGSMGLPVLRLMHRIIHDPTCTLVPQFPGFVHLGSCTRRVARIKQLLLLFFYCKGTSRGGSLGTVGGIGVVGMRSAGEVINQACPLRLYCSHGVGLRLV